MKLSLENIKIGMNVGQDLYTENGQLITPKNSVVTPELIAKLKKFRISCVEVISDSLDDTIFDIKSTPGFITFQSECTEAKENLITSLDSILSEDPNNCNIDMIKDLSALLYEKNKKNINLIDMVYNMHEYSDTVYTHSVNVGMIASHLGHWLGLPEEEIKLLVTCGLFHDIGKLLIPKEILEKPDKLTPAENKIMQSHVSKGFELLDQFKDIDDRVKKVALLHHERCDGSGYYMHLKGDQIDKFSKIIAIADAYEAMTSERAYREPICPFTVVGYFEEEGLHKFETKYVLKFLSKILNSYLHTRVLLSNGQEAKVILINKNIRSKPLVKVDDGQFIDLSVTPEISIVKMVD
ncbi:HD-GYP domain-containing protein [Clostridium aminobutyricum]|uniref:HD-GYP domain-containing protein n=1 Tax=Clostridium aminobutyricum TaxID=33953 RepID=A0A939D6K8_CLOAM|nr:HD-GYP domain-containing protein [Clostridium aminobutyricum]MBN7771991.1 HD-GYP domain-containing protein [Clostridium aminobutyricum]